MFKIMCNCIKCVYVYKCGGSTLGPLLILISENIEASLKYLIQFSVKIRMPDRCVHALHISKPSLIKKKHSRDVGYIFAKWSQFI